MPYFLILLLLLTLQSPTELSAKNKKSRKAKPAQTQISSGPSVQSEITLENYLERETLLSFLNKELFLDKLQKQPPLWMREQIREDFKEFDGISKNQVDATFDAIRKNYPTFYIVRYRIFNNQLYRYFPKDEQLSFHSEFEPSSDFPKEELISLDDNHTEKALKTLLHLLSFKDMDFILSYKDGMPEQAMPKGFYFTPDKHLQAPILCPAKLKGTPYAALIPDWRSLGDWWALDIKSVLSSMGKTPWEKKKNIAFWRGSLTRFRRLNFCELTNVYPRYIDAKLNLKIEGNAPLQAYIEKQGLYSPKVSWEEFLGYKYLPNLDGVMCAASAFLWRLLSDSVILKQESNEIQWFYGALEPYVHYVPIKNDFSNIIEQIHWAEQNDSICKEIAERSTQFALENLMFEDVYLYFYLVLKHYSYLQTLNREEIAKELNEDPRWVNIQQREALKQQVNSSKLFGYTNRRTPY